MNDARPFRVVIAGGGVAGLETMLAVRELAGDRVDLTLVAPDDEFVYRPLAVEEPYAVGRTRRVALKQAAADAAATFAPGIVADLDPDAQVVSIPGSHPREYDALVLALGAEQVPAIEHALTWDDRADSELLGGLLADIEEGYSRDVAVVIPPGPGWPLRGYELALLIAREVRGMRPGTGTMLVTPDPSPLELFGHDAVQAIAAELDAAGVAVLSARRVEVEPRRPTSLLLEPGSRRLEVDRVLALPGLRGRPIAGVPSDEDGFVAVDEHCRVRGLDRVWAAGDGVSFPVKSGGFAAEEGDVVAQDIAAAAGVAIEPQPFDPTPRPAIAGLPGGHFLSAWLGAEEHGLSTHLPATGVPALTYLQRDFQASRRGY